MQGGAPRYQARESTMTSTTLNCRIEALETLDANVTRVFLRADLREGQGDVAHAPGQYLEVAVELEGQKSWVPFSIANAHRGDGLLELHILHAEGSRSGAALARRLRLGECLEVRLPMGECVFDLADRRPLLLIAAGTGFAQMKAIIEAALAHDPDHEIHLWWAARTRPELYLDDLARRWARDYAYFSYHPVLELPGEGDFDGVIERIDRALAENITATRHASVYISGSPGMVYAVVDTLEAIEPLTERVFSDVFSYAPRMPAANGESR